MRFFIVLNLLFLFNSVFSNNVLEIDTLTDKLNLLEYTYFYVDSTHNNEINFIKNVDWEKKKNNNISPTSYNVYNKISLRNRYHKTLTKILFIPHFYIHSLELYQEIKDSIVLIKSTGLEALKGKKNSIIGYPFKITIAPNSNSILYIKYASYHHTYRTTSYLITEDKLENIAFYNQSIIWFWYGIYALAIIIALILVIYFRTRQFLYYVVFILGIFIYVSNHIGFLYLILNINSSNFASAYGNTGTVIINIFFPLFLNELTPIKKHNKKLWKLLFVIIYGMVPIVFLSYFSAIRESWFSVIVFKYTMIGSAISFIIIIYLLAKNIFLKEKNALIVLFIYLIYLTAGFTDIILPNMGVLQESLYVYRAIIISSVIEVTTFLFLIGKASFDIYKERTVLQEKQRIHQKELLKSIVKVQEEERHNIGRDLHDLAGANLSLIKLELENKHTKLIPTIDKTINLVRNLSHGLSVPMLDGNAFMNEIKQTCELFSNESMSIYPIFHNWPIIKDKDRSTHIFRIVQELFQNASKHSKASEVFIQFLGENEDRLIMMYEDDGIGFDIDKTYNGHGIKNIKSRVNLIEGKLQIDSKPQKGVLLIIEFSLK